MRLKDIVKITPRFQRAIRIDTDFSTPNAIEGFVCPRSSADALLGMSRHVAETHQGAFTWTGPYGSGKSSLVVAFGSLLGGKKQSRLAATKALGPDVAEEILSTLPPQQKGWRILPVVGRRANPVQVINEAFLDSKLISEDQIKFPPEKDLISNLVAAAEDQPDTYGGLIVFIDEMGKFLEGAAHENADIHFFQELAEAASRSKKRLIVIGILHQAFEDYANRLSREMRDEWSKIQGRFIDLPINVAGEEQIDLLSRAIIHKEGFADERVAKKITKVIQTNKKGVSPSISKLLAGCWPLHPAVACLLSSISRRRFGQNQRSLFGFLNSAEPFAFQDFLARANVSEIYTLDHLWEYLRINLESSILASPDGHRWSVAVEAIERGEAQVNRDLHLQLLKAIALIDLFKGNTGLLASLELLEACYPQHSANHIKEALDDLKRWSFIIFRGHLKSYSIYAGSDFDIEDAVTKAREDIRGIDFNGLKRLAGLQPILAKRHYHTTGTLRWFDVELVPLKAVVEAAEKFIPTKGTIGQFLLAIPTENESRSVADTHCAGAAQQCRNWDVVVGLSKQSWTINDLALEILATEKVYNENADLGGDSVARREVRARMNELQGHLEAELNRAFDHADWYQRNSVCPEELSRKALTVLASELADARFPESPQIQNELLNRIKPSANAVAAQNALLKRMVMNEGEVRLGIKGFPAEGGLFFSVLEATRLYDSGKGNFLSPRNSGEDPKNLRPIWDAAAEFIKDNSNRTVSVAEIYDIWRMPPFGVRDGLMPVLIVAYFLSERSSLAFYREGIFQARLRDIDIEILAKDPSAIQVRYVELSEISKKLLSGMADIVRELDPQNSLEHLEPIDVGRGLVTLFDNVHPWAQRTMHLSKEAVKVRTLFKKANDPNKFLFDDIPALLETDNLNDSDAISKAIALVYNGLKELKEAYTVELNRLREIMLAELQVPNLSPQALAELRDRANNIKQLSGDFRLEAFVVRLSSFLGTNDDMEGIASLATNKPPKLWVDNDVDRAKIEITALSQKFIRAEAFARVKGRDDKRQSMSVVVGINGRPTPLHADFDVTDSDHAEIKVMINRIGEAIAEVNGGRKNIILAALAELSALYIEADEDHHETNQEKAVS